LVFVDDDLHLLELMEYAFDLAGYQVYTATDGQAGLRQFFDHQPDLVAPQAAPLGRLAGFQLARHVEI
jgi:DNA-binding response OmpR family regulator